MTYETKEIRLILAVSNAIIPRLDELEEGQMQAPEPRDLDLARRIEPTLKPHPDEPGAFIDGSGMGYYGVRATVVVERPRRLGTDHTPPAEERVVWVRFYESYDFGGYWEPPSSDIAYPEASLRGFVSLNAAVCATQFDTLARRQREIDNECHACYGAGVIGFTAEEETKCDKCGGLGFRALPPFPEATPVPVMEEAKPYRDSDGKDHDAVRCDAMIDADCDNKLPGEKATCCVCIGHDCTEARAERAKHPALPG